jgi:hypothetical protein
MSLMSEYINRRFGPVELQQELLKLISQYNTLRETYLLIYATATGKNIPDVSLVQSDFYTIHDLLSNQKGRPKVDVYIETPGGRGETAEEIVRFLHQNFETVSFVVAGEAKSAGTIIVLGGDEILMTETGSLGPIDAQIRVGRSVVSASDYIEWVEQKRKEAVNEGQLNPFDAKMIAQISPGELGAAFHAMKFAEDLVVDWLPKYKFKNWNITETRKLPVTDEMKASRARDILIKLTDRPTWRSHGRSIQIPDLESEDIKLKITHVDDNPELAETVYRIQTVCQLLFDNTTTYKIFATQDYKIFKHAVMVGQPIRIPKGKQPDVVEIEQQCPKCGVKHRIYAMFAPNPKIDSDYRKKGLTPFPEDAKIKCACGFEIELAGVKSQVEAGTGRKIILANEKKNAQKANNGKRGNAADLSEKNKGGQVRKD